MQAYELKLKSKGPYSQSKHYDAVEVPKKDKESADAYERRTWRNRMHVDDEGAVFIPPMALKNCLSEAAKFLSIRIPGKGKATYTKHFEAGVMVVDPIVLTDPKTDQVIAAENVPGEPLFVPADGRRGGSRRVTKVFPLITRWSGTATVYVIDETITEDVLRNHLNEAGNLIGMGRFRPRNNGYYGRFSLVSLKAVDHE